MWSGIVWGGGVCFASKYKITFDITKQRNAVGWVGLKLPVLDISMYIWALDMESKENSGWC